MPWDHCPQSLAELKALCLHLLGVLSWLHPVMHPHLTPPGCRRSKRRTTEPSPPVTSALVLQMDLTPTPKPEAWVSPGGFAGDEGVLPGVRGW